MYSRLQYISQGATAGEQLDNCKAALEGGCSWIQLRFKQAGAAEFKTLAESVQRLCATHRATFIINDHVLLAKELDADGVHVGLSDMPVTEARDILGAKKIIGGTANTLEHVLQRVQERCDYIGLGPFRFTTTKEKLSPVLGAQGYSAIMTELKKRRHHLPVYAIGGIMAGDVNAIVSTGVYGIAVSGAITNAAGKSQTIEQLNHFLNADI